MKAIRNFLAGAAALGAFAAAAPAEAQYYPGYAHSYPDYGGVVGSIIGNITRPYGGYAYDGRGSSRLAAAQCTAATEQRLRGYGRVLGVTSVEIRPNGGYRVRGNALAGARYAYGGEALRFTCRTDPEGLVMDVDLRNRAYGEGNDRNGYEEGSYSDPLKAYGYRRY